MFQVHTQNLSSFTHLPPTLHITPPVVHPTGFNGGTLLLRNGPFLRDLLETLAADYGRRWNTDFLEGQPAYNVRMGGGGGGVGVGCVWEGWMGCV